EFPGNEGNGIHPSVVNQADWLRRVKSGGCTQCHSLGTIGTRTIPDAFAGFGSSVDAWARRIQAGQAGSFMVSILGSMGPTAALEMFADWTDRIAAGEVPPAPPRPQGIERNVVITSWDWADPTAYLHDIVSTDRRNPTVNANGPLYGALEASADYIPVLDPATNTISEIPLVFRDPPPPISAPQDGFASSAYWDEEPIWDSRGNIHNPMIDHRGRPWFTQAVG